MNFLNYKKHVHMSTTDCSFMSANSVHISYCPKDKNKALCNTGMQLVILIQTQQTLGETVG